MIINFSPIRMDETLQVSLKGDIITLNGEDFDFSPIPEGATLPSKAVKSNWITGDIKRSYGVIELTLILPHGSNAPETTRFPEPMKVYGDGVVMIPVYNIDTEAADEY